MGHRHLNERDRFYIEQRLSEGDSISQIARRLGFCRSAISREIKRHTPKDFNGVYNHQVATKLATQKRQNAKKGSAFRKVVGKVKDFIHDRLRTHTSPDVISGELALKHNTDLSESSIYRYINADRSFGGGLYRQLPHSGKPYKPKRSSAEKSSIKNRVGIENRPEIADEKTEFGHFEIDTVVGKGHQSYLLTLVDKANKIACIRKMPNTLADTVVKTFKSIINNTFLEFKTITSDNGTEFAGHEKIAKLTGADFYFARPYRSCDRGLNEHTNGLIRRFFPKGTDFNQVTDEEVHRVEHVLNTRGRAALDYYSPNDLFLRHLTT